MPDVTINLKPLKRTIAAAASLAKPIGRPRAINSVMRLWAQRYLSFVQQRFVTNSRGGGDWAPLAESTKAQRRLDGEDASILWDTASLINALDPQILDMPGALEEGIPYGIRVGFGGPDRHPDSGAATIAEIAEFHQIGAGDLPVRKIIVEPPQVVSDKMARDLEKALVKVARDKG